MPSPFPGMDPFLENPAFWPDFHSRFVNIWCEAIAEQLPGDYEASIGERVYLVENDPDLRRLVLPDVAISHGEATPFPSSPSASVATLEPVTIPLVIPEGPRQAYIEILHQPDRSLVAVMELLSPTNKSSFGRMEYLTKRNAILYQNVHLVELDMLRGGQRPPLQKPWPPGDCWYLVSRYEERLNAQIYSWPIRSALPTVPVPLRAPDRDIFIDLAGVFTTAYDRGRFGKRLPYRAPCSVPLSEEDELWAQSIVRPKPPV